MEFAVCTIDNLCFYIKIINRRFFGMTFKENNIRFSVTRCLVAGLVMKIIINSFNFSYQMLGTLFIIMTAIASYFVIMHICEKNVHEYIKI